uniref:Uncharacterized protein n=1 Tax=Molossus molossus TaxID=27622 RepID=A0A7J8DPX1_MOLMO|nr:hypothetical protein HJG59_009208 [Molossus molossus]
MTRQRAEGSVGVLPACALSPVPAAHNRQRAKVPPSGGHVLNFRGSVFSVTQEPRSEAFAVDGGPSEDSSQSGEEVSGFCTGGRFPANHGWYLPEQGQRTPRVGRPFFVPPDDQCRAAGDGPPASWLTFIFRF